MAGLEVLAVAQHGEDEAGVFSWLAPASFVTALSDLFESGMP